MARLFTSRSKKAGLPPGSLVHVGEPRTERVRVTGIEYNETELRERDAPRPEGPGPGMVTWINLEGIHQVELLRELGDRFGIHPLTLEDILNTDQRPKLDVFDDYLFIVLKMFSLHNQGPEVVSEQISLLLGRNFVISLEEAGGEIFNPVRERLQNPKSRLRKTGADFLAYSLMDAVIDNYFLVLERLSETIEELEETVSEGPDPEVLSRIHELKRELIILRKATWPLRDLVSQLGRRESDLIHPATNLYLADLHDHAVSVIETVESFKEMTASLLEVYLSSMSNRMNEVMKVLTIIATIFIPLSFFAGLYGMNFAYMPELSWRYGYFVVLGFMASLALFMLGYFKRKKWI